MCVKPHRCSPIVPKRKQVSFDHIQDPFDPQPEGERLLVGALLQDPGVQFNILLFCIVKNDKAGWLTLQNLVQGISPSGFLWALAPTEFRFRFTSHYRHIYSSCIDVRTEQFVGQHIELLLVQAPLGDGGELPAEDLRELRPLRLWGVQEELQVLRMGQKRNGHIMSILNTHTFQPIIDKSMS